VLILFFTTVIIFFILLLIEIVKLTDLIGWQEKVLGPQLCYFDMSKNAVPTTVVGMLFGIGYGGALIIREASSDTLGRREIAFAMAC